MERLRQTLARCWRADTAYGSANWSADTPSAGQCAITAVLVQELLGGTIHKMMVGEVSHYYGRIGGRVVDLTADQFREVPAYAQQDDEVEADAVLSRPDTKARFELLSQRFAALADTPLPIEEHEHIAIRDPSYVAGTSDRPEVAIFAQTRTDRLPLPDRRMVPLQLVWMKWSGGPIVARARVCSWHHGTFEDGDVNQVRELSLGTRLFGLDAYWRTVQDKKAGWTSVVRLRDEEWLDEPIFPAARSRGSSWVYLDTLRKKIIWTSLGWEPEPKGERAGRGMPAGLRFRVLRRDSYTCRYCGASAPGVELHVDHVVPWSEVREHRLENLVAACRTCNLGKSADRLPPEVEERVLAENVAIGR